MANLSQDRQVIERCLEILPAALRKGAKKNVIKRVNIEVAKYFPETENTEYEDPQVTQLAKMRYFPNNVERGIPKSQYEALKVVPIPGKTGKTTVLIERLSPAWMKLRLHSKFLKLVRMAAERRDSYGRWIFISAGKAREDKMAPIDMRMVVPIRYTQNKNDTCLLKSFASALH